MRDYASITEQIRNEAKRLGFEGCGIARVRKLEKEADELENWLKNDRNGKMNWMENHFEKRIDPSKLVPGAKSIISIFYSYHQPDKMNQHLGTSAHPFISKYTQGDDYHFVLKEKLWELFEFIKAISGDIHGRVFVDSAPVMDKVWAVQAGLGWMGKNTNIINRRYGSFIFLGEVILDIELQYDTIETDHCGSCTRCIDACPTNAIFEPYKLDGSRCISYLTIELKDEIPAEFHKNMGNWMYGCDICQDVCPWNRKAPVTKETRFTNRSTSLDQPAGFWEEMDELTYKAIFRHSAVKRTKFEGLKRNISIVSKNLKGPKK